MRVLFITNLYPTKNNPDYGVFTKDQIDAVLNSEITGDVIFINAKEKGLFEYWKAIKKIRKVYKSYSIIHCFHGLTLIAAFCASKRIPILVSFLNEIKFESYKGKKLINSILTRIYLLIISTNRVYKIFKDKLPIQESISKRSFYLPNGVDLHKFYPIPKEEACKRLELDPSKRYVLFVSSKEIDRKQKRFDVYRQTINILKKEQPNYNFEELILSNVPREYCIFYYNAATLHLLTSDFEGSPNSVKEAMSCNTPVVSTNVGNVKLMFNGASNCFIAEQEPNDLAASVLKVIQSTHNDLRQILTNNKLTVEDKTNELVKIYETIENDRRHIKI